MEKLETDTVEIKKTELAQLRTGVIVEGISMEPLKAWCKAFLGEYIKLRNTLDYDKMDRLDFGSTRYNLLVQYGVKKGIAFVYRPASKKIDDMEYGIFGELLCQSQGQFVNVSGESLFRAFNPDGSCFLYTSENDISMFTMEFAKKKALAFFTEDLKKVDALPK